jgi:hypothetical protein
VDGGENYEDFDFALVPRRTFDLSGKVELPEPGMPFTLALRAPGEPAVAIARTRTAADGSFRFDDVPEGAYRLYAAGPAGVYTALSSMLATGEPFFGATQVSVSGQSIENVKLSVARGRSFTFTATGTGPGCPSEATLTLMPLEPWGSISRSTRVTFGKEQTVFDLAPGRYRVVTSDLGSSCFQVGQPTVDLAQSDLPPMEIRHALAGTVHGVLLSPKPDQYVVTLLPVEAATPARIAFVGLDGRFRFDELPPGSYRITSCPAAAARSRCAGDINAMSLVEISGHGVVEVELPVARPTPE